MSQNIGTLAAGIHARGQTEGATRTYNLPCIYQRETRSTTKLTAPAGSPLSLRGASPSTGRCLRDWILHALKAIPTLWFSYHRYGKQVDLFCLALLDTRARWNRSTSFDLLAWMNEQTGSSDGPSKNHARPISLTCWRIFAARATRTPCGFRHMQTLRQGNPTWPSRHAPGTPKMFRTVNSKKAILQTIPFHICWRSTISKNYGNISGEGTVSQATKLDACDKESNAYSCIFPGNSYTLEFYLPTKTLRPAVC